MTAVDSDVRGSRNAPFDRRAVLALVLFGFLAFLALLYFIGTGETDRGPDNGRAHAASNGLTGYSGLVRLTEEAGFDIAVSRNEGALDNAGLLVMTPPHQTDAEELGEALEQRRYSGPTLLILPKWSGGELPDIPGRDHPDGWISLSGLAAPAFTQKLPTPYTLEIARGWTPPASEDDDDAPMADELPFLSGYRPPEDMDRVPRAIGRWRGQGLAGTLPDRSAAIVVEDGDLRPVIRNDRGEVLAGFVRTGATLPQLSEPEARTNRINQDAGPYDEGFAGYPVLIVAEPDLMNNWGMANPARAALAMELVDLAELEGGTGSVTFDLTQNGLGAAENLLTLAFRPPFLAATLCLILALMIAGWRAFARFGPALAARRRIAYGKTALVANGAGLIARSRRFHLLTEPYEQLTARRLAKALGLPRADPDAIDSALARRHPGERPFTARAADLAVARAPGEIVASARALHDLERTARNPA